MIEPQPATQAFLYGAPLGLWLTLLATVIVGVLSAAAAIIVVWRSNANSKRNHREQLAENARQFAAQLAHDSEQLERRLAHERDQRERERQMDLRREVYLEAAAALAQANGLIGRTSNLDNDQKLLGDEFAANLAKIAKVQIVGSQETVQAVMNYLNVLGPSFIELVHMRIPLLIRKAAIDLEGTFLDTALAERKRFTAMMQQLNLDQVTDAAKWDPIRRQSEFAVNTHKTHADRREALWKEQVAGNLALSRRSIELAEGLIRLLPIAILAVRSEMDMPLGAEWYVALWAEQLAKMKAVSDKAFANLDEISKEPT
jgi:hypothetical protein